MFIVQAIGTGEMLNFPFLVKDEEKAIFSEKIL